MIAIALAPPYNSPAYAYNVAKAARSQAMLLARDSAWAQVDSEGDFISQLQHDYGRLQAFLREHDVWNDGKLEGVEIIVREPFLGFWHNGMRRNQTVTLFGIDRRGFLIHELVHVFLPTARVKNEKVYKIQ